MKYGPADIDMNACPASVKFMMSQSHDGVPVMVEALSIFESSNNET